MQEIFIHANHLFGSSRDMDLCSGLESKVFLNYGAAGQSAHRNLAIIYTNLPRKKKKNWCPVDLRIMFFVSKNRCCVIAYSETDLCFVKFGGGAWCMSRSVDALSWTMFIFLFYFCLFKTPASWKIRLLNKLSAQPLRQSISQLVYPGRPTSVKER